MPTIEDETSGEEYASIVDHTDSASRRIILQYKGSSSLSEGFLPAALVPAEDLEEVFNDLLTKRSLDTADTAVLNILGAIVGQQRTLADGNGTELSNEEYRLFIRARIIKNNTRATREQIIEMVSFILGDVESIHIVEGIRNYRVDIGRALTTSERALVNNTTLLPKPAGIAAAYTFYDPASPPFFLRSATGTNTARFGLSSYLTVLDRGVLSSII